MTESEIWSSMLKDASAGNATPTGTLLILGTNPQLQTALIRRLDRKTESPANSFGLGYTYIDFDDPEHPEDKISHLDIYTMDVNDPKHETTAVKILSPILRKRKELPETHNKLLVNIVVDWQHVKHWSREIANWITLIRKVVDEVGSGSFQDVKQQIQKRIQTYVPPDSGKDKSSAGSEDIDSEVHQRQENRPEGDHSAVPTDQFGNVELPLESGQYDLPLGVDLVISAVGTEWIDKRYDNDAGAELTDDIVDFATQFVRTIALKHGGSVIFMPFEDYSSTGSSGNNWLDLVSERLEIPVSIQPEHGGSVKHQRAIPSVVDHHKFVIPSGWDSRGKILAVKDGFDVDSVGDIWSNKPEEAIRYYENYVPISNGEDNDSENNDNVESRGKSVTNNDSATINKIDHQEFLAKQYEILEAKISEEPKGNTTAQALGVNPGDDDFNVGGIQVEGVEEVLRRLKAREAQTATTSAAPVTPDRRTDRSDSNTPASASPAGGSGSQNEMLQTFFQNLLDRRRNSPANSPSGGGT